jgi:hypothetical protein
MSQTIITFEKLKEFFKEYKIPSQKIENDTTYFRYICYEKLDFIRTVKLPKIEMNQKNEAVIVDSRFLPHMEFIIRNNILKLGAGWSHTVACTNDNVSEIADMCNRIDPGIKILKINENWEGLNPANSLMYDVNFWNSLTGEHILAYQEDTIMFKNNIKDFLIYDYVGAPWAPPQPFGLECGNGGFSLRSRQKTIEILNDKLLVEILLSFLRKHYDGKVLVLPAEDVFFSLAFKYRSNQMPSASVASLFSSEQIANHDSLGGHKFWLFDPNWMDRMTKLVKELQ